MSEPRLIILDDEPMIGYTMEGIAEAAGYRVRLTADADEFFIAVREFTPDCIVIDLIMPGMDGVQVMEVLAQSACRAGIIIISGAGQRVLDAASRAATESGLRILGVLHKPFRPAELRSMLLRQRCVDIPAHSEPALPRPMRLGAADLVEALHGHQFFPTYQPRIDCRSGAIAGFETLARWQHPRHGVIMPDEFIPLAEANGHIDALTEQIAHKSLDWFAALLAGKGLPSEALLSRHWLGRLRLSINISPLSIANESLFERMLDRMQKLSIEPERIVLELTESSALANQAASLGLLTRLRIKGFQLAIDDFGTGYSSMLQLVRLPFSEIKVDKSFVMTCGTSQESRSVARSIIDLGRSLGLETAAEGVEEEEPLIFLREIGCDLVQGYLISPPQDGNGTLNWVAERCRMDEQARLRSLHSLGMLDTPAEERFDRVTRLARRLLDMPVAMIGLVDAHREWMKSLQGMETADMPRAEGFCTHALQDDQVLVVPDALCNELFRGNPLVAREDGLRFYAGCPLVMPDGARVGALCVMDRAQRDFSVRDEQILRDLAVMVETELKTDGYSVQDPITGLLNRDAFELRAAELLDLCSRYERNAALMLFDLDGFWDIENTAGEGERMLQAFAQILRDVLRGSDLVGRFGGDEFVALLSDTDIPGANALLGRLRARIGAHARAHTEGFTLDFSCGITVCEAGDHYSYQRMLSRVDEIIYEVRKLRA
jgi:diguanylate cyclase (GGDEF)-like protein